MPIHPNTLSRVVQRWTPSAEVSRVYFDDLRHTSATVLVARGKHSRMIHERLGHASNCMTLDGHSHAMFDFQQRAAAQCDTVSDESTGPE